jgi:dihydroorotate dehydrogenase electron transfer subunit
MSNPLHAAHYADSAIHTQVAIEENVRVARDTFRVRVCCDEIAKHVIPGQFVMVRLSGCVDPLMGRPLAVYDVLPAANGWAMDLIYHVKGRFTTRLAGSQPRQRVDLWGPLGNGFPVLPCSHLVMVAGGVGQTPFLTLAKEHLGRQPFGWPPRPAVRVPEVTLCLGAQTRELLAGVDDFEAQGVDVRLATDDGTSGHRGLVTELLEEILAAEACAAVPKPCCARLRKLPKNTACRVSCPWRLRWPAALESVSLALRESARGNTGTTSEPVWRGPYLMPAQSTGDSRAWAGSRCHTPADL